MLWTKRVSTDKADLEIELQTIASSYGFSPKIHHITTNKKNTVIRMDKIEGDTLYTLYGDDPKDIPDWIWRKIRLMIQILSDEEGIEYIDITPYNFMESNEKIYIIDFGDAKYTSETDEPTNWFLQEFLEGSNSWNPDFE
jgi:tRNA A-37 threonylcarbamoyl transferase component Bud32